MLTEHGDRDEGLGVLFAIDPTPDGDAALAQAASGSRGGLSIGAEVDAFTKLRAAFAPSPPPACSRFRSVSLSAFEGAGVERVAAEQQELPTPPEGDPPPRR